MLSQSDSFARFWAMALCAVVLSGCILPEDTQGAVAQYNGSSVTIRGGFSVGDGQVARPTDAMVLQAQAVCDGAQYLSATPTPDNLDTFDYLFRCP